jgi:hypothetical protein
MREKIVTAAILIVPVLIWLAVDRASKSWDRQVKALWDSEEAVIRAEEFTRSRNPPLPPAPKAHPKPGQRDA